MNRLCWLQVIVSVFALLFSIYALYTAYQATSITQGNLRAIKRRYGAIRQHDRLHWRNPPNDSIDCNDPPQNCVRHSAPKGYSLACYHTEQVPYQKIEVGGKSIQTYTDTWVLTFHVCDE